MEKVKDMIVAFYDLDLLSPEKYPEVQFYDYMDDVDRYAAVLAFLYEDLPTEEEIEKDYRGLDLNQSLFDDYVRRINQLSFHMRALLVSKWFLTTYDIINEKYRISKERIEEDEEESEELRTAGSNRFDEIQTLLLLQLIDMTLGYFENNKAFSLYDFTVIPYNFWGDEFTNKEKYYEPIPLFGLNDTGRAIMCIESNSAFFMEKARKVFCDHIAAINDWAVNRRNTFYEEPISIKHFLTSIMEMYSNYVGRLVKNEGIKKEDLSIYCFRWFISTISLLAEASRLESRFDLSPWDDPAFSFFYKRGLSVVVSGFSRFICDVWNDNYADKEMVNDYSKIYSFKDGIDNKFEDIFWCIKKNYNCGYWKREDGSDLDAADFKDALSRGNLGPFYKQGAKTALRFTIGRIAPYSEKEWVDVIATSMGTTRRDAMGFTGYNVKIKLVHSFPVPEMRKR